MHPHRRVDTHVFDRKLIGALALGAVLLAVVLLVAHHTVNQVRLTSDQARATQELRLQLDALSTTILAMETGQRGYLLTGDAQYLEPYERMRHRLPEQIDRLKARMTDNEAQRESAAALTALLDQRQRQMAHALELDRERGLGAAMEFVRTNRGHVTMSKIRALLERMSAEEERVSAVRTKNQERTLQRNFWFSALLSVLMVAMIIVIYGLVRREIAARAYAAEQLDRTNASLEARVRESTAHLSQANEQLRAEIEQRKLAESELQRSHALLEERVRERTAELVEANAMRSRFLSAASHDLRQPLQSLTLLNASLREQTLPPLATRIVDAQRSSLDSMSRLVHALLNLNRLQSGAVQPEIGDVALGSMLRELRTEFAPLARSKQIDLIVEETQAIVRSDSTLLREIIQNLIANAIRYTERGEVRVRVRENAQAVRVEIADTGPGIPADKRELIFEEFQQLAGKRSERREGFGLGLSIVRHSARALGLPIELLSEVGVGTTFALEIPLSKAPLTNDTAPSPAESSESAVGRILLVDDDASVRTATALFLSVSGHVVETASSPEEAFERLRTMPMPDVIITDYHLDASLNGAELILAIRARAGATIPGVILTGDTLRIAPQHATIERCRVFHKPLDAEQLIEHLGTLLARCPGVRDARAKSGLLA